jgi:flagellin
MKRQMLTMMAFGLLAVVAGQARGDLVANGSFDADTPPAGTAPLDWTLVNAPSGSDFFVGPTPGFPTFSPPNSANFGAVGTTDDVLSQTLATTVGVTYTLSYWLSHDSTNSENDFSASWGGVTIPGSVLVNSASFPYTLFTFSVTATSSSTVLAFSGREVPAWFGLDDVSVVSSVPEPSTFAIAGVAGLLGLGYSLRRRFRAA